MKKTRLLPLLFALPLLASCGIAKPSQPKFADIGKQVKAEKFSADLEEAFLKSEFGSSKKIDSGVLSTDSRSLTNVKVEAKDKDRNSVTKAASADKYEFKFDKDNKLAQSVFKGKSETTVKAKNGSLAMTSEEKWTEGYQKAKVGSGEFFVHVNKEAKEYENYGKITKEAKLEDYLDALVKESGASCGDEINELLGEYMMASEEEQKQYKFYENGKIFTVVCSAEETHTEKADGKVVYVEKAKADLKVQIDLTKGKVKALSWATGESTFEAKQDCTVSGTVHKAGDVQTMKMSASSVSTFVAKKVSLKALDITGFQKVGLEW